MPWRSAAERKGAQRARALGGATAWREAARRLAALVRNEEKGDAPTVVQVLNSTGGSARA